MEADCVGGGEHTLGGRLAHPMPRVEHAIDGRNAHIRGACEVGDRGAAAQRTFPQFDRITSSGLLIMIGFEGK
jgi:hypothetical protein